MCDEAIPGLVLSLPSEGSAAAEDAFEAPDHVRPLGDENDHRQHRSDGDPLGYASASKENFGDQKGYGHPSMLTPRMVWSPTVEVELPPW